MLLSGAALSMSILLAVSHASKIVAVACVPFVSGDLRRSGVRLHMLAPSAAFWADRVPGFLESQRGRFEDWFADQSSDSLRDD